MGGFDLRRVDSFWGLRTSSENDDSAPVVSETRGSSGGCVDSKAVVKKVIVLRLVRSSGGCSLLRCLYRVLTGTSPSRTLFSGRLPL